jgi:hypothetical protein
MSAMAPKSTFNLPIPYLSIRRIFITRSLQNATQALFAGTALHKKRQQIIG